jgi:succinate dehydrogenase/fumarate reductase flavoprotein subunit
VLIDLSCRVLDRNNQPIPGLYAVGELTGLAQINGKAALEGTFLGPSIVTGRVAAQSALAELGHKPGKISRKSTSPTQPSRGAEPSVKNDTCLECQSLPKRVDQKRPGYDHFERVHRIVVNEQYRCVSCHSEMAPVGMESHQFDRAVQAENCLRCH